jgi:hypothetical protein
MATTDETAVPAAAASQPAAAVSGFSARRANIATVLQMPPKIAVPFLLCNLGGILILFACMTAGAAALILLAAAVVLSLGSLVAAIIREVVAESSRNRRLRS